MRDSVIQPCALILSFLIAVRPAVSVTGQAGQTTGVPGNALATCERLADSPEDPNRTTPGVARNQIDIVQATKACNQATAENPSSLIAAYDYARAMASAGNFKESEELFRATAQRGYGPAATDYGVSLSTHQNPNYNLIAKYFEQGGSAGHMLGWYDLGRLYINGSGVAADIPKGLALVKTAADGGSVTAAREYGAMLLDGKIVGRDNVGSVKYLTWAADRNDAPANYLLGLMTETGEGAQKDPAMSDAFLQRAISFGSGPALSHVADMSMIKHPGDPSAQARARQMYMEAANLGDDWGIRRTIELDLNGVGGPRAPQQAIRFLEPLVKRGDPWALTVMGGCYRRGDGVPWDEAKAMQLFIKAGNSGSAEAQSEVGRGLMNGLGYDQEDFATAAKWLSLASEKHYGPAELQLGYLYQRGWGVPQDRNQAYNFYKLAESNGDDQVRKTAKQLISELGNDNSNNPQRKEMTPGEMLAVGATALFIVGMLSPSSSGQKSDGAEPESSTGSSDYINDMWQRQRELGLGQAYCRNGAQLGAAQLGVMC